MTKNEQNLTYDFYDILGSEFIRLVLDKYNQVQEAHCAYDKQLK